MDHEQGFESWWGPDGFRVEVHALEARRGGILHYDTIADSPQMIAAVKQMGRPTSHEAHVRFTEITPHDRLAITSVIDFVPGLTPYESTIVEEFFRSGETVRMVVTLDPMHSEEFTKTQTDGFTRQLSKLDKRYSGARRYAADCEVENACPLCARRSRRPVPRESRATDAFHRH